MARSLSALPCHSRSTITFDVVRKIGLTLPGAGESVAWSVPALKLRGKLLACVSSHCSAQLALRRLCCYNPLPTKPGSEAQQFR